MHEELMHRLSGVVKDPELAVRLRLIRVLCGPVRYKILALLSAHKPGLRVTDLASVLHASLSRVSHQLRILRKYDLVVASGTNRETLYTIKDGRVKKMLSF